jgi:putative ABC transport system permease protein
MLTDFLKLSLLNLKNRKLRSWLTMLGIFIGIAAVVALISLGQGLQNAIDAQFQQLGHDKITVMGKVGQITSPMASLISSKPLTDRDLNAVRRVNGIEEVTGWLMKSASMEYKKETRGIFIEGIDPETIGMFSGAYAIEKGRDLKKDDKTEVVIGHRLASSDFGRRINVGNKILLDGNEFEVVGIMKKMGTSEDSVAYLHINAMREYMNEPEKYSMLFAQVKNIDEIERIKEDVESELKKLRGEARKEEPVSFVVQTSEQLMQAFGNIFGIVQAVLIGIAAISLFVGGVGTMNTMYTAVLERTKEIGIMKAIGARNSDILLLFLIESSLLGLVGGGIGVFLGLAMGKGAEFVAANLLGTSLLKAAVTPELVLGALLFSLVVGALSGTLPALQASRMNPVDSLRHE